MVYNKSMERQHLFTQSDVVYDCNQLEHFQLSLKIHSMRNQLAGFLAQLHKLQNQSPVGGCSFTPTQSLQMKVFQANCMATQILPMKPKQTFVTRDHVLQCSNSVTNTALPIFKFIVNCKWLKIVSSAVVNMSY